MANRLRPSGYAYASMNMFPTWYYEPSLNALIPCFPRPVPVRNLTSSRRQSEIADFARHLRKYLLTPDQLYDLGYPVAYGSSKNLAQILRVFPTRNKRYSGSSTEESIVSDYKGDSASSSDNDEDSAINRHSCARCGSDFLILRDKYLTTEKCLFHYGRLEGYRGYSCCRGDVSSAPCTVAKRHVWSGTVAGKNGPLTGFVTTQHSNYIKGIYALDCEMCYTTAGLELCKVSVIDVHGNLKYNEFVRPSHPVVDYNTRFSGVSSKDISKNCKSLRDVQLELLSFIKTDTILIGHALENDLLALKIIHKSIVDTSVAFPHPKGLPFRRSLRVLCKDLLTRDIQCNRHDSLEDARASLDLMIFKVSCDKQASNSS